MSKKIKLFGDITSVSRQGVRLLQASGLVKPFTDEVVSWVTLAPFISKGELTEAQAKRLILLELQREEPREIIITRLVNYISSSNRSKLMEKINKITTKK